MIEGVGAKEGEQVAVGEGAAAPSDLERMAGESYREAGRRQGASSAQGGTAARSISARLARAQ